jgi:hypothetical protein
VLGLVGHVAAEVAANNAVPGRVVPKGSHNISMDVTKTRR